LNLDLDTLHHDLLVGGFNPSEKYQSLGRIIPFIMENQPCLKPLTRWGYDGGVNEDMMGIL
jgi:hypothetical protein